MGAFKPSDWQDDLREAAAEARILAASFPSEQAVRDLKAFAAALERDIALGRLGMPSRDETVPSA